MPLTRVQAPVTRVQESKHAQIIKSSFEVSAAVAQMKICEYLEKRDLLQLPFVSKSIQKVADNDRIWAAIFQQSFPSRPLLPQISPKQQFLDIVVANNFPKGKCVARTFQAHEDWITAMKSFEGFLVSGSQSGEVKVWRKMAGKYETVQTLKMGKSINCIDFHDGLLLVGTLEEIAVFSKNEKGFKKVGKLIGQMVHGIIVFEDNLFVADQRGIKIWKKKENRYEPVQKLKRDRPKDSSNFPTCFHFHDRCLYLGSESRVVEIWEKKGISL